MRGSPVRLDGKKLDIKSKLIVLSVQGKIYFLLDKGVVRKALENFDASRPKKLGVLTSHRLQSQSFKFKKHAAYAINSFNYIVSLFQSRRQSADFRDKPIPQNEGQFFRKIQEAVFARIRNRILESGALETTLASLSQEEGRAILGPVQMSSTEKVGHDGPADVGLDLMQAATGQL